MTKFRDGESVGVFHNNVYLLTCQSASLQSAFVIHRFPRRRYVGPCPPRWGGGGTPSFGLDGFVPLNGVWFSGVLLDRVHFYYLAS